LWNYAEKHLAGWVPCASSHLSFSLMGTFSRGAVTVNSPIVCSQPAERRLVIYKERITRDEFGRGVFGPLAGRWRRSTFVLRASSVSEARPVEEDGVISGFLDGIGALAGRISVIPYHSDPVERAAAKVAARTIKLETAKFPLQTREAGVKSEVFDKYDAGVELNIEAIRKVGGVCADFEFLLCRTGEFRVRFIEKSLPLELFFKLPGSVGEEAEKRAAAVDREELARALSRQVYYFVKESIHKHYHHEDGQDSLLPLTESVVGGEMDDDSSWRRETLWALARCVHRSRQGCVVSAVRSACGFSAYADAFSKLLGRIRRTSKNALQFENSEAVPRFDWEHTRASMEVLLNDLGGQKAEHAQFVMTGITVMLATLGLWISSLAITVGVCSGHGRDSSVDALHVALCDVYSESVFGVKFIEFVSTKPIILFSFILIPALLVLWLIGARVPILSRSADEIRNLLFGLGVSFSLWLTPYLPQTRFYASKVLIFLVAAAISFGTAWIWVSAVLQFISVR